MTSPRALLFGEAVTLAHVARPVVLGNTLHAQGWEVHLAVADTRSPALQGFKGKVWSLRSITSQEFTNRISAGRRPYEPSEIEEYVHSDIRLIRALRPAVVIGDFRLSLPISAALTELPSLAITNAYWNPGAFPKDIQAPDLPIMKYLPPALISKIFQTFSYDISCHCARPINRIRRQHGLPELDTLESCMTAGDAVLHPDIRAALSIPPPPSHHHFIDLLEWTPAGGQAASPPPGDEPLVYVSLGSSGAVQHVHKLLAALEARNYRLIVATAKRYTWHPSSARTQVHTYLDPSPFIAQCRFVVTNGGSPGSYQALRAGVPVLGVASNTDQMLMMAHLERADAGVLIRGRALASERLIDQALGRIGEDSRYRERARAIARSHADLGSTISTPFLLKRIHHGLSSSSK